MRLFASERIAKIMDRMKIEDGERIESPIMSRAIEYAQKKVEENNFGIRKHLLEYDDVMNKQRTVIYDKRRHALIGERIGMDVANIIWDRCVSIIENNDYEGCKEGFLKVLAMECPFTEEELLAGKRDDLAERAFQEAMASFKRKNERMQSIAYSVISDLYQAHGDRIERIAVPVTDGRHIYQIPCNFNAAYTSECRRWSRSVRSISSSIPSMTSGRSTFASSTSCATVCRTPLTSRKTRFSCSSSRVPSSGMP